MIHSNDLTKVYRPVRRVSRLAEPGALFLHRSDNGGQCHILRMSEQLWIRADFGIYRYKLAYYLKRKAAIQGKIAPYILVSSIIPMAVLVMIIIKTTCQPVG